MNVLQPLRRKQPLLHSTRIIPSVESARMEFTRARAEIILQLLPSPNEYSTVVTIVSVNARVIVQSGLDYRLSLFNYLIDAVR